MQKKSAINGRTFRTANPCAHSTSYFCQLTLSIYGVDRVLHLGTVKKDIQFSAIFYILPRHASLSAFSSYSYSQHFIIIFLLTAYNPYRAVYQKKPYLSWSSENMKQAIIAVRTKAMGLKQAGIRYGVPRTTLQRRCKAAGSPDVCSIKRTGVRKTIVDEFIEEAPNMDKMAALTESLSAE